MREMVERNWMAILTLLVCSAVLSTPAWAAREQEEGPAIAARRWRGGGGWEHGGGSPRPRRWEIDAIRTDDDTLTGEVMMAGSPLAERALLRGTICGRRVSGAITDRDGHHVADFTGVVGRNGSLRGTYQDRTGEVGRWSWEGSLPR
jgi:hypothetical protein